MATEFLVKGATEHNEPGVFIMFEENPRELAENVSSMGIDLVQLQNDGKLLLDHVHVERSEIDETGEYDLEGLFIRLGHAVDKIGAKRVVLDTIEVLFSGLANEAILRSEIRRLFRWLKDRGLTTVITAERGDGSLTRYGLEEYVADCVILLDHRVSDQISTRRLRVVKYRGSAHGTNEYPFLIDSNGISILPITSLRLEHTASTERISTGVVKLDEMLDGKGVYRGSSILISGMPGTGKTTMAAMFANAACGRGERCIFFTYEESPAQFIRNMNSIGLELRSWIDKGLLEIHASRPTFQGLEQHLVQIHEHVRKFKPALVVIDPISSLTLENESRGVKPTLIRVIDMLKQLNITAVLTNLVDGSSKTVDDLQMNVSSLMDTWILLRNHESKGENTRTLLIQKSRGMQHSDRIVKIDMSNNGLVLTDEAWIERLG